MRVEMVREVCDAPVRVVYDDVVMVRHHHEADHLYPAERRCVRQRIQEQRDRFLVGFEQELPHRAAPRQEVIRTRDREARFHAAAALRTACQR